KMIEVTNEKVAVANEKLKEARTRQINRVSASDRVFLKVSPARRVRRFGIKGNLSPHFIRPFEILDVTSSVVACSQRVSRLFA
nr:putative reverse transcriptase domain-containing protein [Tanacetum cinerariifolium]